MYRLRNSSQVSASAPPQNVPPQICTAASIPGAGVVRVPVVIVPAEFMAGPGVKALIRITMLLLSGIVKGIVPTEM
jgi:hypothetical protein